MGDIIDFKSRNKIEVDQTNIINMYDYDDKVFRCYFSCAGNSVTMDRNAYNNDIILSLWKEDTDGEMVQLGVAFVPAEDIDEAIVRLNSLVAFADISEITEVH